MPWLPTCGLIRPDQLEVILYFPIKILRWYYPNPSYWMLEHIFLIGLQDKVLQCWENNKMKLARNTKGNELAETRPAAITSGYL